MSTSTRAYDPEQIADARKLLDAYANVPTQQRPIFTAMITAFISGMDTQKALADEAKTAEKPVV